VDTLPLPALENNRQPSGLVWRGHKYRPGAPRLATKSLLRRGRQCEGWPATPDKCTARSMRRIPTQTQPSLSACSPLAVCWPPTRSGQERVTPAIRPLILRWLATTVHMADMLGANVSMLARRFEREVTTLPDALGRRPLRWPANHSDLLYSTCLSRFLAWSTKAVTTSLANGFCVWIAVKSSNVSALINEHSSNRC
jgi:hypothetical protein